MGPENGIKGVVNSSCVVINIICYRVVARKGKQTAEMRVFWRYKPFLKENEAKEPLSIKNGVKESRITRRKEQKILDRKWGQRRNSEQ